MERLSEEVEDIEEEEEVKVELLDWDEESDGCGEGRG